MICATGKSGQIGRFLSAEITSINGRLTEECWKNNSEIPISSVVMHLAGIVGESNVLRDEDYARKINIDGTLKLAKYVLNESNAVFYFLSSSHVYQSSNFQISESGIVSPSTLYGRQKVEAEEGLLSIYQNHSGRLKILRIFSILNKGMKEGTLGSAIDNVERKKIDNGDDVRDFLTAQQAAIICEKLARRNFIYPVVNVCTGVPTKIKDAISRYIGITV